MHKATRNLLSGFGALAATALLVVACGSSSDSTFNDGEPDSGDPYGSDGSFAITPDGGGPDSGDLYENDLPSPNCPAPDTLTCCKAPNPPRPPVGGTKECPDDKNKPGCGCTTPGETAACWTGLRKNRGLGICKDGTTTCRQVDETSKEWGPCEGEVLPVSGATKGKEACQCFSAGQWKLANLSPCTMSFNGYGAADGTYAVSTVVDPGTGVAKCPTVATPPPTKPAEPWSKSTLKVDCAGHFKLCLRIRQGNFDAPSPSDCILGEVCTESDYVTANVEQAWPDLPSWLGADKACAAKWDAKVDPNHDQNFNDGVESPGYAEMVVKGMSVTCEAIDDGAGNDFIFNRVKYCPGKCRDAANASDPVCVECQQSGQGQF